MKRSLYTMPALRLRVKLPKEPTGPETAVSSEPQPGLFRRILHRAVSKTNSASTPHAPPPSQAFQEADVAPPHRNGRGEATPPSRPKSSFRRLRSKPDQHPEGEVEAPRLRTLEAYVPRHAANGFSRTASRDGSARFPSFDEDPRKVLDSLPTEHPGTSPGLLLVTPQSRDRLSGPAGAEKGQPLKVAGLTGEEGRCRIAPLQPPPTTVPAKRHATHHSYKLASDPFEAPPELSDYQKFIQKAVEEDRRHREELWRSISQRSLRGRNALVRNHPDSGMSPPVEVSRRERQGSTGGKRTSLLSYRSHADRQERRPADPGPPRQVGMRASNPSLRRLHDYFKPQATVHSPKCR